MFEKILGERSERKILKKIEKYQISENSFPHVYGKNLKNQCVFTLVCKEEKNDFVYVLFGSMETTHLC